jgi:hypothetical protein
VKYGPIGTRSARRSRLRLVLALSWAAVFSVLATVPTARAAGTLDQSVVITPGVAAFGPALAQTFTAGISGNLDQVDLMMYRSGSPGDLTVQIRSVFAGVPSDNVLASARVVEGSVGTDPFPSAFVSIPLSPPAPVSSGVQYAIVWLSPGCCPDDIYYAWTLSELNPYAGGELFAIRSGGTSWEQWPLCEFGEVGCADVAFKTYVTPSSQPVPTNKAECKKGGYAQFGFKNQGQCVAFVQRGPKS